MNEICGQKGKADMEVREGDGHSGQYTGIHMKKNFEYETLKND